MPACLQLLASIQSSQMKWAPLLCLLLCLLQVQKILDRHRINPIITNGPHRCVCYKFRKTLDRRKSKSCVRKCTHSVTGCQLVKAQPQPYLRCCLVSSARHHMQHGVLHHQPGSPLCLCCCSRFHLLLVPAIASQMHCLPEGRILSEQAVL